MLNTIKAVMLGGAVGDALGVPVEFSVREKLTLHPVTEMMGYGSFDVPAGSWSDDTSMSVAALDSLKKGVLDYDDVMQNFIKWLSFGEYTPEGKVFVGWALEGVNDEGLKTLTVVFGPTENGVVVLPAGTILEPMTLFAHFENA